MGLGMATSRQQIVSLTHGFAVRSAALPTTGRYLSRRFGRTYVKWAILDLNQ